MPDPRELTAAPALAPFGPPDYAFTRLGAGDDAAFDALARAAFDHQTAHNPVYAAFAEGHRWRSWRDAPYLPVEAFRLAPVAAFDPADAEAVFESSGTGQGTPARHYVRDLARYEAACVEGFRQAFGDGPFTLVAHLPGYTERGSRSSLLYMMEGLVRRFGAPGGGFFLSDDRLLERAIRENQKNLIVFGAAFGLLDLLDRRTWRLPAGARVVETGGMKTHRREVSRDALHARLADGFGVPASSVGSEYGMAELTSQAWARAGSVFATPPWLRFRVVDPADPTRDVPDGMPGGLALCDLAGVDGCPFVLTEDRAVVRPLPDGGRGFEVLGRLERAALRGCNFLVETP